MKRATGTKGKADRLWSLIVRDRAGGRCQRCGTASDALQAAHLISRRYGRTRTELDNGLGCCPPCHRLIDDVWHEKQALVDATIGRSAFDALWEQARGTDRLGEAFWRVEVERLTEIARRKGLV